MYGYIYKTTDSLTNGVYIGQHKASKIDTRYYGSGDIIREIIRNGGKHRLSTELLLEARSKKELDELERVTISYYRKVYKDGPVYNKADGGQSFNYENLLQPVTMLLNNKEYHFDSVKDWRKHMRDNYGYCPSREFSNKAMRLGKKGKKFYIFHYNKYPDLIDGFIVYKDKEKDFITLSEAPEKSPPRLQKEKKMPKGRFQKVTFILDDVEYHFDSVRSWKKYMKDNFGYSIGRESSSKAFELGSKGRFFNIVHVYKYPKLSNGFIVYKDKEKDFENIDYSSRAIKKSPGISEPMTMIINGEELHFPTVTKWFEYLRKTYNYRPGNQRAKEIYDLGSRGEKYYPNTKCKGLENGFIAYKDKDKKF